MVRAESFLEFPGMPGFAVVALTGTAVTVGGAAENDVVVRDDPAVSPLHAVIEQFSGAWILRDVSSPNRTWVNDVRTAVRQLRDGDVLRVGGTRIVFRGDPAPATDDTDHLDRPRGITRREREVLAALIRPMVTTAPCAEPASARQIAVELWISERAVNQVLLRLYRALGVAEGTGRRARLANEAVQRGVISIAQISR